MTKNVPYKTRYYRIYLLGLTLVAFTLRTYNLGQRSLWYDELLQLDVAQSPLANIWPQLARHAAMPLDYYLLHGWIQLGRAEVWVRWPALFFGTLAVPLIYALASRMFNRRVGLLAATLLTTASFAIQYSQEVRPYALLTFFTMTGCFGLWQAYARQSKYYWGLVLGGLIGATLTHYFALFMLLPLGLFVAGQQLRHLKRPAMWGHTASFALCLLLLGVVLILSGHFNFVYNVSFGLAEAIQQPSTLTQVAAEKPNRGSGPPLEISFFVDKVFGPLSAGKPAPLLLYNAFLLIAILSLLHPQQPKQAAILLLLGWLILPILAIYFFLLYRGTFYAIRYILYTLPAYLILIAYGLDICANFLGKLCIISIFRGKDRRGFAKHLCGLPGLLKRYKPLAKVVSLARQPGLNPVALLTCTLLILPLLAAETGELQQHYAADSTEDWRAVGQLLRDHARPHDVVIAVWAEPALNWYYPPATAPFQTYNNSQPIWHTINQHSRRWFILSSYSQKRDRGLRNWLSDQGVVTIGIDRRVVVYLQDENLTTAALLAEVKTFKLPRKALTYATLAGQLHDQGDVQTSRMFYQTALDLADPEMRNFIEAQIKTKLDTPVSNKE